MGILKRLVVYVQINNFSNYYKMDRKILILGITLTVVILFLSFRKEGYEESVQEVNDSDVYYPEEELLPDDDEVLEDSFDLKSFLEKLRALKDDEDATVEAVDAFYGDIFNSTDLAASNEEAQEGYNREMESQIGYLRSWMRAAQEQRESEKDRIKGELQEGVDQYIYDQGAAWYDNEYDISQYTNLLARKSLVKVDNHLGSKTDGSPDINRSNRPVSFNTLMSQATGDPLYQTTSGLYRKEDPKIHDYYIQVPKCGIRTQDGEFSCLNMDGIPANVDENGIGIEQNLQNTNDAFVKCASACVNSDECSGFSLSLKPDEQYKYKCKLTRDKFEDVKTKLIDDEIDIKGNKFLVGEDVYAIHEGFSENDWESKLKNPLYFALFNGFYGTKGLKFDTIGPTMETIKSDKCKWRTDCDDIPTNCPAPDYSGQERYFGDAVCGSVDVILNDGLPENCEGNWESIVGSGVTGPAYDPNNPKNDATWENGCPRNIPNYGDGASNGNICYNHDPSTAWNRTKIPYYYKKFVANGADAINGGSCPDGLTVKQTCREGDGGETGREIQICEYSHGGWYDNDPDYVPVNCGADGPNQPGNVSTSQVTLGDCDYGNQSCPDYPGYQGGRIEGTKKVIGYDSQGKPAKNGGKSCDSLMRERIIANDPYWGLYKIVGNDIVAECGRACFSVPDAGPPPCDPRFSLCDSVFNPGGGGGGGYKPGVPGKGEGGGLFPA
jgi:hypothetical protein